MDPILYTNPLDKCRGIPSPGSDSTFFPGGVPFVGPGCTAQCRLPRREVKRGTYRQVSIHFRILDVNDAGRSVLGPTTPTALLKVESKSDSSANFGRSVQVHDRVGLNKEGKGHGR